MRVGSGAKRDSRLDKSKRGASRPYGAQAVPRESSCTGEIGGLALPIPGVARVAVRSRPAQAGLDPTYGASAIPFATSHFEITSSTSRLFLSIISMWLLPLMPCSGRLTTSALPPAAFMPSA